MSHYDLLLVFLVGILSGSTFTFVGYVLSAMSWDKADQLLHEDEEIEPIFPLSETHEDNPLAWDKMPLTINCQACQDESEQML